MLVSLLGVWLVQRLLRWDAFLACGLIDIASNAAALVPPARRFLSCLTEVLNVAGRRPATRAALNLHIRICNNLRYGARAASAFLTPPCSILVLRKLRPKQLRERARLLKKNPKPVKLKFWVVMGWALTHSLCARGSGCSAPQPLYGGSAHPARAFRGHPKP